MEETLSTRLNEILIKFTPYFVRQKLIKREESLGEEIFYDFVGEDGLIDLLDNECDSLEVERSDIIYRLLTEEQKKIFGGLFSQSSQDTRSIEEQCEELNFLEKKVLGDRIVRAFKENVQPFLTSEKNVVLVSRLANLLYEGFSEEEKKQTNQRSITTYILSLGFIRNTRASHRQACDFIIEYPPLFKGEEEVLDAIVGRYIDEELTHTPINKTDLRIKELKEELNKIYYLVRSNES